MGLDLVERLARMRKMDRETHTSGKDASNCRGVTYDVDYVNLQRVLDETEATDLYEGLERHPSLILYNCVMEEPSWKETFVSGYSVLFAPPGRDRERVLTFGEKQLPSEYRERFLAFNVSKENKQRARAAGMRYISQFAGGSVEGSEASER